MGSLLGAARSFADDSLLVDYQDQSSSTKPKVESFPSLACLRTTDIAVLTVVFGDCQVVVLEDDMNDMHLRQCGVPLLAGTVCRFLGGEHTLRNVGDIHKALHIWRDGPPADVYGAHPRI